MLSVLFAAHEQRVAPFLPDEHDGHFLGLRVDIKQDAELAEKSQLALGGRVGT